MRMRKKSRLDERLERQGDRLIRDPEARRGRWRELLPGAKALRVELGCGKGRFTAETARLEPETLLIAVERVPDAMVTAMERSEALSLPNVFFIDADAARLGDYFAPGEVDGVYLNFSDPWPSSRQAKRRLTHPDFLRKYARAMAPGGQIFFKTDNRDLFEWSLFQFPKAGFTLSEVTRDLHRDGVRGVMTDYEEKFFRQGKPICRCVATRGDTGSARLKLVRPLPEHEEKVWAYREAFLAAGEEADGASGLREAADYESWRTHEAVGNRPGWVRADTFLALTEEGKLVGMVNVRHSLEGERLAAVGGHIGYSVHPDLRRRGYATELLALALDYCRDGLGLHRVLVTCHEDNAASARTILHFAPELEGRAVWEGRTVRRYWITLK